MNVVRSVRRDDLDALVELAGRTGPGLTSLKPDRAALATRIERVLRTVEDRAPLAEQGYLFVLEERAESGGGRVIGVCGLEAAVGLADPFYNYRVSTIVHASRELGIWTRMSLLDMTNDLTGYAELCSLFLDPAHRAHGNGALLSKARFLFLAQFAGRFPARVCAELRGHFDAAGESPFWRAVGAHFYQIDFNAADYLTSHGERSFLAELMPRYPVYVELLPDDARRAIGATHADTAAARRMLEAEGMRYENHVDIFDAGPVLECHLDNTRGLRESRLAAVEIAASGGEAGRAPGERFLTANTSLADFRCGLVRGGPVGDMLRLSADEARALCVVAGDAVRVLELNPPRSAA